MTEIEEFRDWREWNYTIEDGWELESVAARILNDLQAAKKESQDRYVELRKTQQQRDAAVRELNFLKNSAGIRAIWGNRVRINYRDFLKTLSFRQKRYIGRKLRGGA